MYQDYIDGKKELKDINMEFRASYVSGDMDKEEKAAKIRRTVLMIILTTSSM